ncbi:MAG: polysaccharide lyase family 1 protein [Puniceicoccaceae bacterium]
MRPILRFWRRPDMAKFAWISVMLVLVTGVPRISAQEQEEERWAGYLINSLGYVATPTSFLGQARVKFISIERPWEFLETSWVYSEGIGGWFYLEEVWMTEAGSWAYALEFDEDTYDFNWADLGWLYARRSGTWVWVNEPDRIQSAGNGWVYILYGESLPDDIVVTSEYSANMPVGNENLPGYLNARPANEAELARFEGAMHLGLEELLSNMEPGPDVSFQLTEEGIVLHNAGFGNRSARFFYHPRKVGLIDLSGLQGITGEIGVTMLADVDLTNSTGGFYCHLRNEGIVNALKRTRDVPDNIAEYYSDFYDVGSFSRLEKGIQYGDVLLENHVIHPFEAAFIELVLPAQATVTVKSVFLNLETAIRGFAGMEEKITGGTGAPAENIHTVSNVPEMQEALLAVRNASGPSIIYVDGTMTLDDWEGSNGQSQQFNISDSVRNLSIIGIEGHAVLDGMGFKIHGTNVILENLTIRNAWMQDAFEINNARYIRVSYCTAEGDNGASGNRFDEFISIKNTSRYIIISWNHLRNDPQGRGILIGSNDEIEALPDRSIIIHHNWFQTTGSRHPLVRGGYSHIYNNFFDDIGRGSNVRTFARTRIENNYYYSVSRAIFLGDELPELSGRYEVAGNFFEEVGSGGQPTDSTVSLTFEDAYTYELDSADAVPNILRAQAGAIPPLD